MKTGDREYNTLHKRLGRKLGKPTVCENCGVTGLRHHWSHIHEAPFTDSRDNWTRLCPKCHTAYDDIPEQRSKNGKAGGYAAAGIPRHEYNEEFKTKVSNTLKSKGIKPPSRKGETNKREVCLDCGVEYGSNWLRRHKTIGRCV